MVWYFFEIFDGICYIYSNFKTKPDLYSLKNIILLSIPIFVSIYFLLSIPILMVLEQTKIYSIWSKPFVQLIAINFQLILILNYYNYFLAWNLVHKLQNYGSLMVLLVVIFFSFYTNKQFVHFV